MWNCGFHTQNLAQPKNPHSGNLRIELKVKYDAKVSVGQ